MVPTDHFVSKSIGFQAVPEYTLELIMRLFGAPLKTILRVIISFDPSLFTTVKVMLYSPGVL